MATGKPDAWSLFLTAHALVVEEIEKRLSAADLPPLAGTTRCGAGTRAGRHGAHVRNGRAHGDRAL